MAKTVQALLDQAVQIFQDAHIESARADARILLMHVTGLSRADMIASPDTVTTGMKITQLQALINRRVQREPIAYLTGTQPFWTLNFAVTPDTLIPRPETEDVVRYGLESIMNVDSPRILDVGTGSGAILLSLLSERIDATGIGTDISQGALRVAQKNADAFGLGTRAEFTKSDMYDRIPGQFDLIVSNPPYINSTVIETLEGDVRRFEPHLALDGGPDGLMFYKILIQSAKAVLTPCGEMVLEIGYDQAKSVVTLLLENGFKAIRVHKDLAGHDRIVTAKP